MISPAKFAKDYASFWNALFPMADALVRTINLNYERFAPEKEGKFGSDPRRRGLLNEAGFELARLEWPESKKLRTELIHVAFGAAAQTLLRLDANADVSPPTGDEWGEVEFLANRLLRFCRTQGGATEISFAPLVRGCGFVDGGRADLLIDSVVCEVKSGDRNFRVIDLRQAMTYSALLDLDKVGQVSGICLLNPRRGVFYKASCNDICITAGGATAADCFSRMTSFICGAFNSV